MFHTRKWIKGYKTLKLNKNTDKCSYFLSNPRSRQATRNWRENVFKTRAYIRDIGTKHFRIFTSESMENTSILVSKKHHYPHTVIINSIYHSDLALECYHFRTNEAFSFQDKSAQWCGIFLLVSLCFPVAAVTEQV